MGFRRPPPTVPELHVCTFKTISNRVIKLLMKWFQIVTAIDIYVNRNEMEYLIHFLADVKVAV